MILENTQFLLSVLFGLPLLIAGIIQYFFPPKEINSLYGYRTKRSMKNNHNWKIAQIYSAKLLIVFGLSYSIIAFISLFIKIELMGFEIFLLLLLIVHCGVIFVLVEKRLRK